MVLVYGAFGETHETAFISSGNDTCVTLSGSTNYCQNKSGTVVVNYETSGFSVVEIGSDVLLYIVGKYFQSFPDSFTKLTKRPDRNTAYTFWAPEVSSDKDVVFVKGPYLVRSAVIEGNKLSLRGDLNSTAEVEIIAPRAVDKVEWNGNPIQTSRTPHGSLNGTLNFTEPTISLPDLASLTWVREEDLRLARKKIVNIC